MYDKELFNYEEYMQEGMSDSRLLRNFVFMPAAKGSKNLVAEFFKYQQHKYELMRGQTLELNSSPKIIHNLHLISIHVESLFKVH